MIIRKNRLTSLFKEVAEHVEIGYKEVGCPFKEDGMYCQAVIAKKQVPELKAKPLQHSYPEAKLRRPYDTDALTKKGEVFLRK